MKRLGHEIKQVATKIKFEENTNLTPYYAKSLSRINELKHINRYNFTYFSIQPELGFIMFFFFVINYIAPIPFSLKISLKDAYKVNNLHRNMHAQNLPENGRFLASILPTLENYWELRNTKNHQKIFFPFFLAVRKNKKKRNIRPKCKSRLQ